ncbi:MAG TPA: DUF4164 family protein [Caulobacteraceae bacterium]|jgi:hypothetical protein
MARQPRGETAEPQGPVEAAAKRLDRAVAVLETRLSQAADEARDSAGSLFDSDRARLTEDLDRAAARERELRAAGEEASQALGRAIAEIRGAMGQAEAP